MTSAAQQPVPFCKALYRMIKEHPDVISWDSATGSLIIPDPKRLEKTLLEYFRHGRYASFQRQLNNFGYRRVGSPGNATVYRRELSSADAERGEISPESILSLRHVLRRSHPKVDPIRPMHRLYKPVLRYPNYFYPTGDVVPVVPQDYIYPAYEPPPPPVWPTSPQSPHIAAHALLSLKQQLLQTA